MSRAISIFGLGYVGTVTAACLAHQGNRVIGVDLSPAKVEALKTGNSPIVEPGVADLISGCRQASRLDATRDSQEAVLKTDISFLCVGTPSMRNGKLDLGHIGPVCQEIGTALRKKDAFHLVVLRSTVLPGTAETIVVPTLEKASGKKMGADFGVCVNPEFMREGTAVADFLEPSITILGAADPAHSKILRDLYAWVPGRVFETSFRSAEMAKYVCNAWHAVKVSFANEARTAPVRVQRLACREGFIRQRSRDTGKRVASRRRRRGRDLHLRHQTEHLREVSQTGVCLRWFVPAQGRACSELSRQRTRS